MGDLLVCYWFVAEEGDQVSHDRIDQSQRGKAIFTKILGPVENSNISGYILIPMFRFSTHRLTKRPKNK